MRLKNFQGAFYNWKEITLLSKGCRMLSLCPTREAVLMLICILKFSYLTPLTLLFSIEYYFYKFVLCSTYSPCFCCSNPTSTKDGLAHWLTMGVRPLLTLGRMPLTIITAAGKCIEFVTNWWHPAQNFYRSIRECELAKQMMKLERICRWLIGGLESRQYQKYFESIWNSIRGKNHMFLIDSWDLSRVMIVNHFNVFNSWSDVSQTWNAIIL